MEQPNDPTIVDNIINEAIKKSKDIVSVNYAEAQRLAELVSSHNYTLIETQKSVVEAQAILEDTQKQIEGNKTTIVELADKITEMNKSVADLAFEVDALTKANEVSTEDMKAREEILKQKEADMVVAQQALADSQKAHEENLVAVSERENKIKELVKTL